MPSVFSATVCATRSIRASAEVSLLFQLKDVRVAFSTSQGESLAVRGVDIDVAAGEVVAIVGESGSGKSQTLLAALGLLPGNGRATGSAKLDGEELIGASEAALNRVRGSKITMIFQEPMTALDPLYSIGDQIAAPLIAHAGATQIQARTRAGDLLEQVGLAHGRSRARAYPHQLSGGERQRAMIAMAIANRPRLLIADEPTTALDVTVQAQILDLLVALQRELGVAMIFVSHDLRLVRRIAQRVYVMRAGVVIEAGATETVLARPSASYTRTLVDAEPSGAKPPPPAAAPILMEARDLVVTYLQPAGLLTRARRVRAVEGVSLTLRRGQTLGVVGESGSGKSTLARALLRLTPCEGRLTFEGRDLQALDARAMRPLRRRMQLIFQDPFGSLSPRLGIGAIVAEGLRAHEPHMSAAERDAEAVRALEAVGIDPASRERTPDAFSGGQRQRIAIARALILEPALLLLDEPTSSLDRSIQRDILALLRSLQDTHGLTYLFITHDLAVVRAMADEILVMKGGKLVEQGPTEAMFERPAMEYTRQLIRAAGLADRAGVTPFARRPPPP
jgi:oligopeptide transport system ATP-binding protein